MCLRLPPGQAVMAALHPSEALSNPEVCVVLLQDASGAAASDHVRPGPACCARLAWLDKGDLHAMLHFRQRRRTCTCTCLLAALLLREPAGACKRAQRYKYAPVCLPGRRLALPAPCCAVLCCAEEAHRAGRPQRSTPRRPACHRPQRSQQCPPHRRRRRLPSSEPGALSIVQLLSRPSSLAGVVLPLGSRGSTHACALRPAPTLSSYMASCLPAEHARLLSAYGCTGHPRRCTPLQAARPLRRSPRHPARRPASPRTACRL